MPDIHDLTPEQELEAANRALAEGDSAHATRHLAVLLAVDPTHPAYLAVAEALLTQAPENAAELVPWTDQTWFGNVALRAWLLERTGKSTEALTTLLAVMTAQPGSRYLEWARQWVREQRFLSRLDAGALAGPFAHLAQVVDGTSHREAASTAAEVLTQVRAPQRDHEGLMYAHTLLLRKLGRTEEAVALARSFEQDQPGYMAAVALGAALREAGHTGAAVEAFRRALALRPDDLSVRMDIADNLWHASRFDEALQMYDEALAREPAHPWALPSALFLRGVLHSDARADAELRALAQREPANARARDLLARADAAGPLQRPWRDFLPPPAEATLNAVRQVLEQGEVARGTPEAPGSLRITVSALEAPSTLLAARLAFAGAGWHLRLEVTYQSVPTPDPRLPRKKGFWTAPWSRPPALWRYTGTDARPAVPVPPHPVLDAVVTLARSEYSLERWTPRALEFSERLRAFSSLQLAAAMVHPPPVPEGSVAWEWVQTCQLAAALLLAQREDGRALLSTMLEGQEDWYVGAAAVVLAHHASHIPSESEAMLRTLLERLKSRPSHGYWCLEHPLLSAALWLSEGQEDIRSELQAALEQLEQSLRSADTA